VPKVDGYGIEIVPNGVDDGTGSRQRACDPSPHVTGSAKHAVWIRGDGSGKVAEHAEIGVGAEYEKDRPVGVGGIIARRGNHGERGRWRHDNYGAVEKHAVVDWQEGEG
jgi:hypothetical protein